MLDPFGVWVYRFSDDGTMIEEAFRINWGEYTRDLVLLGWWEPGESVMIRDISNPSTLNPLGEVVVWSLSSRSVVETISGTPTFAMTLYSAPLMSGVSQVDQLANVLLSGSAIERAAFANTIIAGCTQDEFVVGPPPCEVGMSEGTQVERFPYRLYREQRYVTPDEIPSIMEFEAEGVYAIYAVREAGFASEWLPAGEYRVVLVEATTQYTIEVVVEGDRIVLIEFWDLTPPEVFHDFNPDYILPPRQ
jgi:hypothetical protein